MNFNKLVYPMIVLGSFILISCASTTSVVKLSSEVHELNEKIDKIEDNINVLKPEIEHIKNEAIKANKRLDNQNIFYRK